MGSKNTVSFFVLLRLRIAVGMFADYLNTGLSLVAFTFFSHFSFTLVITTIVYPCSHVIVQL